MSLKDNEIPIFVKELARLYSEYKQCTDSKMRGAILEDMLLISKSLSKNSLSS
jgi:hypothetical protein